MSEGPVAIVTGGSQGIGFETACLLAKEGYSVVICSRHPANLARAARKIKEKIKPAKILTVKADVSKPKDVQNLVKRTVKKFGRIDALINNAGVLVSKLLIETSEKEWNKLLDTNLKGIFLCSKEVVRHIIKQGGGTIVNISSEAGRSGFRNLSAYCASKFGVIGLTESLAMEVNKYKIRVVAICPGPVETKMQKEYLDNFAPLERLGAKIIMQKPQEIAKFVLYAILGKYPNGSSVETNLGLEVKSKLF